MGRHRQLALSCLWTALCFAVWAVPVGAARPAKQIYVELQTVTQDLSRFGGIDNLVNPMYRPQMQEVAVPLLKKKVDLLHELEDVVPSQKDLAVYQENVDLAICAAIGDEGAARSLAQASKGSDAAGARSAMLGLAMRDWWADPSPDAQRNVLNRLVKDAKEHPNDDALARTLVTLAGNGAATRQLARAASTTVGEQMGGAFATLYRRTPNKVNWPLTVSGTTVQGKSFSTAQWKGKVVMVDFWATWCGPCLEEMPGVVDIYNKYHSQGLEIVGVSNDSEKPKLLEFLKQHLELKWPQLYGPSNSPEHWNALSEQFKVSSIPTVYLIDRNGVLRTTTARNRLEELIAQLLHEEPDPTFAAAGRAEEPTTRVAAEDAPPSRNSSPPPAGPQPAAPSPASATAADLAEKAQRALSLARSYVAAQRYDSARTRLKKLLADYPSTPAAEEAKRMLAEIEGK